MRAHMAGHGFQPGRPSSSSGSGPRSEPRDPKTLGSAPRGSGTRGSETQGSRTRAVRAIGHLRPEVRKLTASHFLPWSLLAGHGIPAQQSLLVAAERLAHLPPGLSSLGRIRAELKNAALYAVHARSRGHGRADGAAGIER